MTNIIMDTMMAPDEVLDKAADYIEEHGWVQKFAGDHGGPRCAVGALESVASETIVSETTLEWFKAGVITSRAAAVLQRYIGIDDTQSIPVWNDEPGRTKEEVVDNMRWAAKDYRNGA